MTYKKVILLIITIIVILLIIFGFMQKKQDINKNLVGEWVINSIQDEDEKDIEIETFLKDELYDNIIVLNEDKTFVEKNKDESSVSNGVWEYKATDNAVILHYESGNNLTLTLHLYYDSNNIMHLKCKVGFFYDYCKK